MDKILNMVPLKLPICKIFVVLISSILLVNQVFAKLIDTDGDGISDAYEEQYDLNKNDITDASSDRDKDGLTNLAEYLYGLSPDRTDSDGDGLPDSVEVRWFGVPQGEVPDKATKAQILGSLQDNLYDVKGVSIFGHCDDDKLIMHVLNRLTFGPTPQLYARLKGDTACRGEADSIKVYDNIFGDGATNLGWINEQLESLGIPKERKRRARKYKNGNSVVDFVKKRVEITGVGYQMLHVLPKGTEDVNQGNVRLLHPKDKNKSCGFNDDPVACECDLAYDPAQCVRDTAQPMMYASHAAADMEIIRPVMSNQHIRTRLGKFWDNHFNTDIATGNQFADGTKDVRMGYQSYMNELYESDTFFMGAFGNFYQDLLLPSAMSPTMIRYLDTDANIYDGTGKAFRPNENYARELLELHTIGEKENIDYDHEDILALGRVFTGWSVTELSSKKLAMDGVLKSRYRGFNASRLKGALRHVPNELGYEQYTRTHNFNYLLNFQFNHLEHDPSEKILTLGDELPFVIGEKESGIDEGKAALKYIADLPNTAEFICTKLSKLLVSDNPALETIKACQTTFLEYINSDEQVKQIIKTLVSTDQFQSPKTFRTKFKDRWEYLYSFLRTFEFDTSWEKNSEKYSGDKSVSEKLVANPIQYSGRLGSVSANTGGYYPFSYPSPDGEPEDALSWMTADQILKSSKVTTYLLDQQFQQNRRGLLPLAKFVNRLFDSKVPFDIDPKGSPSFTFPNHLLRKVDKVIIGEILNLMFGANYQASDVVAAYKLFNQSSVLKDQTYLDQVYLNDDNKSINFSRLKALVVMLANVYEFRIQ